MKIDRLRPIIYVPDPEQDESLLQLKEVVSSLKPDYRELCELILKSAAIIFAKNYMDRRFDIPNAYFLKQILIRLYEHILVSSLDKNGDLNEEAFRINSRKAGIIMIDANFLKAFNDHYGYESGTRYLQLIAKQIDPSSNEKLAAFLKKYNIELTKEVGYPLKHFPASYGGDEFITLVYFLHRNSPITLDEFPTEGGSSQNILEEALLLIQRSIEEIDLKKELGVDLNDLAHKLDLPYSFEEQLIASAPGAAMTLSIDNFADKIHLEELETFPRILEVLMGEAIDEIGRRAKKHKDLVKEAWRHGTFTERFVAKWFSRDKESEEAYQENARLEEENQRLTSENLALQKSNAMLKSAIWALGFLVMWLMIFR